MSQDSSRTRSPATAFWGLIVQSRLLTRSQCQQLATRFQQTAPADGNDPKKIAQWLVQQNIVSRYQATILLGGRAGPFRYDDYKVYDRIEKGRLANWFRAVHVDTNHPVLLKFLTGEAARDARLWARLVSGAPRLSHPNVARCFDAVDLGAYKFLVLEDLRGKSLSEALQVAKQLPAGQACSVARMAAIGLAALHQSGRPHGDIRPKNLWLATTGAAKLLVDPELDLQPPNLANADPAAEMPARADYFAPEYLQPGKQPDALTDIYALGCTLYEMIAGHPPFPGGLISDRLQRHATEAIQPLESFGAPPAVGKVVAYMMAKNPAVRFQHAAMVADRLAPLADPVRGGADAPPSPDSLAAFETALAAAIQTRRAATAPGAAVASSPAPALRSTPVAARPATPSPARAAAVGPVAATARGSAPPAAALSPRPGAGPQIKVDDEPPMASRRGTGTRASKSAAATAAARQALQRRQRQKLLLVSASVLAVVAATAVIAAVALNRPTSSPTPRTSAQSAAVGNTDMAAGRPSPPPRFPDNGNPPAATSDVTPRDDTKLRDDPELVADNGDVLWASPTRGTPISFDYLPGGAQAFLIVRPAAIARLPEGERVLRALGPDFESVRAAWESAAGLPLDQIEQIVVGFYPNGGQPPRVSCVVRPAQPVDAGTLQSSWGDPSAVTAGSNTFFQGSNGWAYFLPENAGGAFVMGHPTEIQELAETNAAPPLLRREIGQLLRASDAERHVTVLFAPNFLFTEGRPLFAGERAKALDALTWFLGDSLKAGMVSVHLDPTFYVEMQMQSDIATDQHTLASQVRDRMREMPPAIETYLANLNPHPYWRIVANRYPLMIGFLHDQTRIGVEGNHAVLNAVLPQVAAHNLVFGGEMVLASTPGVAVATAPDAPSGPQTLEDVLQAKISLSFAQDSLEFAMQNVVTEVKSSYKLPFDFKIKILGDDLKLDGITRNQQIRDFQQADKTVAEVLTALVRKANPVTTVTSPNEKDQKLLWVLGPDPDEPSQRIVLITTRQVAEQKYTLPGLFRTPE